MIKLEFENDVVLYVGDNGAIYDRNMEPHPIIKGQYLSISQNGLKLLVHRLVASAYIPNPDNKPFVNHKDGNKYNNCVDNLEWVTAQENILHAYISGLRNDNKPIRVYDTKSDTDTEYYSCAEFARTVGINGEKITRYMKSMRTSLFLGRYIVAWDYEDWEGMLAIPYDEYVNGTEKSVSCTHLTTGQRYIFGSLGDACAALGLYKSNICVAIKKNKPYKGYVFSYVIPDNLRDTLALKRPKPKPPVREPLRIIVLDVETNISSEWNSLEEFTNTINVKKNTVQKSMLLNSGRYGKYQIKYVES